MSFRPRLLEGEGFLVYREAFRVDLTIGGSVIAISGKNGNGKSSVLNAIMFVLFGEVFGVQKGMGRVIHDLCDTCWVRLTFGLGDRLYRATRTLVRGTRGVSSQGLIEYHDGEQWRPIDNTGKIGEYEDWITRRLKLRKESFQASAALMQNQQSKLVRSDPREMLTTFGDLISLGFWDGLDSHVRLLTKENNGQIKALTSQLEEIPPVTAEEAEETVRNAEKAEAALASLAEEADAVVALLGRAEEKDRLSRERATLLEEAVLAERLAGGLDGLRTEVEVAARARDQLPFVTGIVRGSDALSATRTNCAREEEALSAARLVFNEERESLRRVRTEEEGLAAAHRLKVDEAETYSASGSDIQKRLGQASLRAGLVAEIAKLEGEIRREDQALGEFKRLSTVVSGRDAVSELRRRFDDLERALGERDRARMEKSREDAARLEVRKKLAAARIRHADLSEAVARLKEEETRLDASLDSRRQEFQKLGITIDARQSAIAEDTCLACGSSLDEHRSQSLCAEIPGLKEQLESLRAEGAQATELLREKKAERSGKESELSVASAEIMAAEREEATQTERLENLDKSEKARRDEARDAWAACFGQAQSMGIEVRDPRDPQSKGLISTVLVEREAALAIALPQWDEMSRRNVLRERMKQDLLARREALQEAPDPGLTLAEASDAAETFGAKALSLRNARDEAEALVTEKRGERERLQERVSNLAAEGVAARGRVEMLQARALELKENVREATDEARLLGWPDDEIPDQESVEHLRETAATLAGLEKSLTEAMEAQRKQADLRARADEADRLLAGHAETPALPEVRARYEENKRAVERARVEARGLLSRRDTTLENLDRRRRISASLDAIDKDAARDRMVSSLIGPKQLQARLMHQAMAGIIHATNQVLMRISDARLSLELNIAEESDEFEILVRDAMTPARAKEIRFISGGQEFRISVALAIGIGQFLAEQSNTNRIGMLIIDEGFGALDEEGLDSMLGELDQIAETVGLVLVVTHNEKVLSAIPDRYHVTYDREAYTARIARETGYLPERATEMEEMPILSV